jgi:hypothetical protein
MQQQYIIALIWLVGFLLSYWMLKAEHESEAEEYTNGDKAWQVILSTLSWLMVFIVLIKAWVNSVNSFWNKPLLNKKEVKQKDK